MKQSKNKLNQITEYINEMMNDQQGVGLSVAIVKDSRTIYSKGFGYSQIQPVNSLLMVIHDEHSKYF